MRLPIIATMLITLTSCSDSDTMPSNDAPVGIQTNTAQVLHEGLPAPTITPSLRDVFQTDRDSHWLCSFSDASGNFFWQTAAYFYSGNGESVYNLTPDNPTFPQHFEFTWSGEQVLTISSDSIADFTVFGFRYETDPANVLDSSIIYQFVAEHSMGGFVVCAKVEGER